MPGLVPGIHVLAALVDVKNVDGRDEPGHDEIIDAGDRWATIGPYEQVVTFGGRQIVVDWRGRAKNWSLRFIVPVMNLATPGV